MTPAEAGALLIRAGGVDVVGESPEVFRFGAGQVGAALGLHEVSDGLALHLQALDSLLVEHGCHTSRGFRGCTRNVARTYDQRRHPLPVAAVDQDGEVLDILVQSKRNRPSP